MAYRATESLDPKMAVNGHTLGWSAVLGLIAAAEGRAHAPSFDPRMGALSEATKYNNRLFGRHVRERETAYYSAIAMRREIQGTERLLSYDDMLAHDWRHGAGPRIAAARRPGPQPDRRGRGGPHPA